MQRLGRLLFYALLAAICYGLAMTVGGRVAVIRPLHPNWEPGTLPDGVYWWTLKERAGENVLAGGLKIMRK